MANGRFPHSRPRGIALGGILSALAVILLITGGVIPIGTFAAPIFAGIALLPVSIDLGARWALLCYLAVSALSLFLVPDLELKLFFILLLGWYPIFQPILTKIKNIVLRYVIKLLIFNAATAIVYTLMLFLFSLGKLRSELAGSGLPFLLALLAAANLTFVLYDSLLDRARLIYVRRLRRRLFK